MSIDFSFLEEKGIDTKLGKEYTGGTEKYLSALKRYFSNYEGNRKKIEDFYACGDFENYMIQVHALKSNSEMVGAISLSEEFEALEKAASEGNISFIELNGEKALLKYGEFVELLRPIGEADIEMPANEINGEEALLLSKELLEALDDYDEEKSAELAKKLLGYPFRMRQQGEMNKAIKLISDFCYDDAAEIIKEISGTIE
jgi:HPt (histidine-containing phosphotransfer) domain-containing protein